MAETKERWQQRPYIEYDFAEDAFCRVWRRGLLAADGDAAAELTALGRAALEEKLDYGRLHGSFCVVAYRKDTEEYLFFGDNAGSQFLFFDRERGVLGDSFLALCRERKTLQPDFRGVAAMLDFELDPGERTAVFGIGKTRQDCFYRLGKDGAVRACPKGLRRFSDMPRGVTLDAVFAPILRMTKTEESCAICTGGTDSRTVLSDLRHHGAVPELLLTAHPGNPDILPAAAVAKALGRELRLVDFSDRERGWLEKGFCFLDGTFDAVLAYRHLRKARYARARGYRVEYGGVGGELYKNSFCNVVRNWRARSRRERLDALLEDGSSIRSSALFGEALRRAEEENEAELRELAADAEREDSLLAACNRLGYRLLCAGSGAITNGYAAALWKIDPLIDRSLVASASQESLFSHRMHRWQRREIRALAPQLAELPTDQGYTCSLRPSALAGEMMKKLGFFADRAFARLRRMLGMKWKSMEQRYWDEDYLRARGEPLWSECVRVCRERGILAPPAAEERIPLAQTGNILLLGLLFGPAFTERFDSFGKCFLEEDETETTAESRERDD